MRNIHFQHNALSAAEITSRRLYKLHRVRLFSPALCRVNRGSKIIVQGISQMQATPQQLIILPADVELEVINQPDNGLFCSDLLSLTADLLADFKARYMSEPPPGRLTSLCAPMTLNCRLCGRTCCKRCEGDSTELQHHQTMGLLLALQQAGYAGPLLNERQQDLTAQVRQIIMLSPAEAWSVPRVAKMLFVGESTLRRRLQQESQSFRLIVEEVRMAYALGQLQSTSLPIGEIALNSGYQSGHALPRVFVSTMACCRSMYADENLLFSASGQGKKGRNDGDNLHNGMGVWIGSGRGVSLLDAAGGATPGAGGLCP
jgi:AraC-like DNA-binding protein